ncbi:MAG: threonine/serine dehydratase [Bacteroidota bacterium]
MSAYYPSRQDIETAHERILPYIHRTPVLTNAYINQLTGCEVYFKAENFQKIGAFKARGGLNAALSIPKEKLGKGLCTHSSGNHAQAIAYAAKMLQVPAFIVMPSTANKVKVAAVRAYGAEVIFCEPNQKAREEMVQRVEKETGAYFIHPYNDIQVIEGQATAAKELLSAYPDLELLFVPVGGGGLLSGTCLSAKYFGKDVKVYAGEPEAVNDAWQSIQQDTIAPATGNPTIADGLTVSLGNLTYPIIKQEVSGILTVKEDEIRSAMKLVWERMKIVIEPSSAVPLAALLANTDLFRAKKIGIIISGGNVDLAAPLPFQAV